MAGAGAVFVGVFLFVLFLAALGYGLYLRFFQPKPKPTVDIPAVKATFTLSLQPSAPSFALPQIANVVSSNTGGLNGSSTVLTYSVRATPAIVKYTSKIDLFVDAQGTTAANPKTDYLSQTPLAKIGGNASGAVVLTNVTRPLWARLTVTNDAIPSNTAQSSLVAVDCIFCVPLQIYADPTTFLTANDTILFHWQYYSSTNSAITDSYITVYDRVQTGYTQYAAGSTDLLGAGSKDVQLVNAGSTYNIVSDIVEGKSISVIPILLSSNSAVVSSQTTLNNSYLYTPLSSGSSITSSFVLPEFTNFSEDSIVQLVVRTATALFVANVPVSLFVLPQAGS